MKKHNKPKKTVSEQTKREWFSSNPNGTYIEYKRELGLGRSTFYTDRKLYATKNDSPRPASGGAVTGDTTPPLEEKQSPKIDLSKYQSALAEFAKPTNHELGEKLEQPKTIDTSDLDIDEEIAQETGYTAPDDELEEEYEDDFEDEFEEEDEPGNVENESGFYPTDKSSEGLDTAANDVILRNVENMANPVFATMFRKTHFEGRKLSELSKDEADEYQRYVEQVLPLKEDEKRVILEELEAYFGTLSNKSALGLIVGARVLPILDLDKLFKKIGELI